MRIIAGQWRGRPLRSLKGDATRPTTDRVREALMSALISARGPFEGARVLDAFSGSGALGLEALSRGAQFSLLNEASREAARVIEGNLSSLGVGREAVRLRKGDAFTLPTVAGAPFDLIFLDPPYAFEPARIVSLVAALDEAGLVAEGAVVCYEHAKKDKAAVEGAVGALQYRVVSVKDYGDTSITTLRKEAI